MLPCVGDRLRSRAKFPRIEVFGAEARATGAGPVFSGFGVGAGTVVTFNSDQEPECFPEAGDRDILNYPFPASQILAMRCHPCGFQPYWTVGALPAAQRPPANRRPLGLLTQSVRHGEHTTRTIAGSLNGSQAVAY